MQVLALIAVAIGSILLVAQARPYTNFTQPPERCTDRCIDGVFALDVSQSISRGKGGEDRFNLMKDVITTTFGRINISSNCNRVGLFLFANDARLEFNLSAHSDLTSLQAALNNLTLSSIGDFREDQGTDTPGVLNLIRTTAEDGSLGLNNESIQIAVVITDGRPHIPGTKRKIARNQTKAASNALNDTGIFEQIFAIGINGTSRNKEIDEDTLRLISGDEESTFLLSSFDSDLIQEVARNLSSAFCNLTTNISSPCLSLQCPNGSRCRVWNETGEPYCEYSCAVSNGGCDEGSQCIEVDVPTCSPGQCCSPVNITCLQRCTGRCIDGVFALDVSKSIGNPRKDSRAEGRFNLMKNVTITTFERINISSNCNRVGLFLFAKDARLEFNLSAHTDLTSLQAALDNLTLRSIEDFRKDPGTNTPGVLNLIKTTAEDGSLGLNNESIQIAVVITDGRPHMRGTSRTVARNQTEAASNALNDTGIFEQIFAVGINGTSKDGMEIDEDTLRLITGDEESTFLLSSFDSDVIQEVARNLSSALCILTTNISSPCLSLQCPNGSRCRVCNETGEPYCEYSCAVNNGGCDEGSQCIEVDVPTCSPGQCCSPVNITCLPPGCEIPCIDGVFVLDVSRNITEEYFQLMKDFVARTFPFVNISTNCSRAGLILFASDARIEFDLNEHIDEASLRDALDNIKLSELSEIRGSSGTNTSGVLNLMRTAAKDGHLGLSHDHRVQIAVVITAEGPNLTTTEREMTETAANRLHGAEIYDQIYVVGVQGSQKENRDTHIRFIADPPELTFLISDFSQDRFNEAANNITKQFCDPCTSSPCPLGSICTINNETRRANCVYTCNVDNGGCDGGNRCVELDLPTCRPGQRCSLTCFPCGVGKVDSVYVLDVSRSIEDDTRFGFMRNLVIKSAQLLPIGKDDVLFSLVLFARHANIMFNISQYNKREDLIEAISGISYFSTPLLNRTGTNIAEALDLVREAGQDGRLGLRPNATFRNVIFITDGRSNTINLTATRTGKEIMGEESRMNQLMQDENNSIEAANKLKESKLYDNIFSIGIKGRHNISVEELKSIASCEEFRFDIKDFSVEAFIEVERQLFREFCPASRSCPVEGQVYLQQAPLPLCQPTCSDPIKHCNTTKQRPSCVCPEDTVIDEVQNRCIPLLNCTCSPQCSYAYCNSTIVQDIYGPLSMIPCTRGPPPYTEDECQNDCRKTNCQDYFNMLNDDPEFKCN